jgi:regulator of protease activity HflC (stomatin/prohibitin superfamily)
VLLKEQKEAERKKIEAEGIKNYQQIISLGLSELLIRWNTVQAFEKLSASPNTKTIITNGGSPMMLNATDK